EIGIALPALPVARSADHEEYQGGRRLYGERPGPLGPARLQRRRAAGAPRARTALAVSAADAERHAADGAARPARAHGGIAAFQDGAHAAVRRARAAAGNPATAAIRRRGRHDGSRYREIPPARQRRLSRPAQLPRRNSGIAQAGRAAPDERADRELFQKSL